MTSFKRLSFISFVIVLILSIMLPATLLAQWHSPMAPNDDKSRIITVAGNAEVHIDPDVCILRMGVETEHKDILEARKQNDKIIKDVIAIAKRYGIKKEDIHVDYIFWDRSYGSRRSSKDIPLKNTVEFEIWKPKPEKFEDFIFDALSAGMTAVLSVDFRTTEMEKYRNEARGLAMENAKSRANSLVAGNGVAVGKPLKISEGHVWQRSFYNNWWGGSDMYTSQRASVHSSDGNSGSDLYAPGKLVIKAAVNVVYELQDE